MSQWDWIARPEHYKPRLMSEAYTLHGVTFPFSLYEDGPPGWPCRSPDGGTASPGSTWVVCNKCRHSFAHVPRGGDGNTIARQELSRENAVEFHNRNCTSLSSDPGDEGRG